jgi:hypothetical protein
MGGAGRRVSVSERGSSILGVILPLPTHKLYVAVRLYSSHGLSTHCDWPGNPHSTHPGLDADSLAF